MNYDEKTVKAREAAVWPVLQAIQAELSKISVLGFGLLEDFDARVLAKARELDAAIETFREKLEAKAKEDASIKQAEKPQA